MEEYSKSYNYMKRLQTLKIALPCEIRIISKVHQYDYIEYHKTLFHAVQKGRPLKLHSVFSLKTKTGVKIYSTQCKKGGI